jgi:hypothetical protein
MRNRTPVLYIEPSNNARRWFWIFALIWVCAAAFLTHFDDLFPVTGTALDQIEGLLKRSFCAAVFTTIFYLTIGGTIIFLAVRTVRTKQWPPRGMAVPFRARATEIRRPVIVWLYAAVMLLLIALQIGISFKKWQAQKHIYKEALQLIRPAARSQLTPGEKLQ